jgi:glucose-6-phosphate isomerase
MNGLRINLKNIYDLIPKDKVFAYKNELTRNMELLHNRSGKGSDFLGWLSLPSSITKEELADIEQTANGLKKVSEIVVVIGIGGSYLGAKAVIEALNHTFPLNAKEGNPIVIFAGHNICEDYHHDLLEMLDKHSYSLVVISKSGTTTEPAIAFRLLKQHLENKIGKAKAAKQIVAITDKSKGALRKLAEQEGYKTFVIPDDVGGRYSVLTPVGLLPIAVAGFNIQELVKGAVDAEVSMGPETPFEENLACIYAAARNALYSSGWLVEIMVNFTPKLHFLTEWWKQLFGESEGKENKGIFTAGVDFTTDLHSMGQYIQEGERILFETVISVDSPKHKLTIPTDKDNLDELNYISGKRLSEVNQMAQLGTALAHVDGRVPNISIHIPEISEYWIGHLMYFFEKSCALSGYTLGVNPFDQPGVEAYKKNMFALLGKEGFEEQGKLLLKRIE